MSRRFLYISGGFVLAGGALACIGQMLNSVHFGETVDFGTPPPPIVLTVWGEEQNRAGATQNGKDEPFEVSPADEAAAKAAEEKKDALHKEGLQHESAGEFTDAIASYEQFLKSGGGPDSEEVLDRVEVMREAKTPSPLVMTYLSVQRTTTQALLDATTPDVPLHEANPAAKDAARPQYRQFANDPVAGFIKAHALYQLASLDWPHDDAAGLYEQAALQGGPRKERALIMAARCLLRQGAVADNKTWEDAATPSSENVAKASAVLGQMQAEFPAGHFAQAAEGLRARILFLQKRYPQALAIYLPMFAQTSDPEKQARILSSIKACVSHLSNGQAGEVQDMILKDPSLLQPYLDYRLYHTEAKPHDLGELIAFVKKVSEHSKPELSAGVLARLAEIEWLLHETKGALSYSTQSLAAASGDNDRRDLAHFIQASCYGLVSDTDKAAANYLDVLKTPGSYLANPARENLALLYERSGRWNDALDMYWQLDYTSDVAYLLDARMTTDQIQHAIDARGAADSHHDLLLFSLGMRYLRGDELARARDIFASIPQAKRDELSHKGSKDYAWVEDDKNAIVDSLFDPLESTNDLIGLRKSIADASGDDAKAAAMYKLATYYYTHRNLLLYNASLWEGGRNWMFGAAWNDKAADKDDRFAVASHHYEHESLYHARKICLAIVDQYPKSKIAPQALYRAATASRRLANFSGWWRERNKTQDLYKNAADLLDKLAANYATDPLAKNAKKYAGVFREEGKGEDQRAMFTAH